MTISVPMVLVADLGPGVADVLGFTKGEVPTAAVWHSETGRRLA